MAYKSVAEINKEVEARLLSGKTSPCPKCGATRVWYQGLGAPEWHCEGCIGSNTVIEDKGDWKPVPKDMGEILTNATIYSLGYEFLLGKTKHTVIKHYDNNTSIMHTSTKTGNWEFFWDEEYCRRTLKPGNHCWKYRKL